MDESVIRQYIGETFPGVDVVVGSAENESPEVAWGDTFFFHEAEQKFAPDRRFPFATIVTKDYAEFDAASKLNRPGVFRLNIGLSRETYGSLFKEDAADADHDFAALDRLMPHPVYGKMHWVCVLNPSAATFETLKPLLAEAYQRAASKPA